MNGRAAAAIATAAIVSCPGGRPTGSRADWPVALQLDAVGSSDILKGMQKLGVTFNFDKQNIIDFAKFSKMTMCRASEANSEK